MHRFALSRRSTLAALSALLLPAASSFAQTARVTTLVVPYTPGTGPDTLARVVGARLGPRVGTTFVVENKPGASGNIGADYVAKAKPDGSVLMVTVNTFTITPALYKSIPYNPITDFTHIAKLAIGNLALVVNANVAAQNFEQFLALVRSKPGALSYGSPGNGTPQHLAMEVLKKRFGLDILHVPYKGAAGANQDLIGGQIQMAVLPIHTALPFVRAGKIRMLAVSGDKRAALAPDVPSMGELGAGNVDLSLYFWLAGPAGLPAEEVTRLNREVAAVMAMPDVEKALAVQGMVPATATPAQLSETINSDIGHWKQFVTEQKIHID